MYSSTVFNNNKTQEENADGKIQYYALVFLLSLRNSLLERFNLFYIRLKFEVPAPACVLAFSFQIVIFFFYSFVCLFRLSSVAETKTHVSVSL